MITTPTVFLVGAGGGIDYSMLTGRQLQSFISRGRHRNQLREGSTATLAAVIARVLEYRGNNEPEEAATRLIQAARDTRPISIDALIEQRDDLEEPGKAAIAASLLHYESTSAVGGNEDWLGYLLSLMLAPRGDFGLNEVAFVTFNYDRVIEDRITQFLASYYDLTLERAWDLASGVPIVHVYGQLGDYSPVPREGTVHFIRSSSFAPPSATTNERCSSAMDGLRLIHDRSASGANSEALRHARQLISSSSQLFCLGFGYDATNIERLATAIPVKKPLWKFFGTTLGLAAGETRLAERRITNAFQFDSTRTTVTGWKPTLQAVTCEGLLRQHVDLLQ